MNLPILVMAALPLVSFAEGREAPLVRFWTENAGKTVRRLPTWVCPEDAFFMIHGESLKPGAENANAALMEMLAEKGTYNFVTLTLRCHSELGDAETEREVKKVVDVAHRHGIGVGMDLDPRIARREFLRRWPDDVQRVVVAAKGSTYASGRAVASISAKTHGDHMTAGTLFSYEPMSAALFAAYAVRFDGDCVVPGSVRKVAAKPVAQSASRLVVEAEGLAADETLVAFGDFRLHSCDVYSEHLIPFTRELMARYRDLGADAAMRDEWGFPSPSEDGFHDGRCFWYSPGYAAAYAKRTGRTLADDLIVMAYPAKGDDSLRYRLAGEYMYLNFERNAEIEEDMYATSKRLWGEDCFVTKHPTWYGQLEYHNIWHDGMDWWRARRDWAQSDEAVPRCALLGMMRKFGGPNWLNEWYSGTPASYHTNIWRYAVAGARMVVHPLFDPQPFRIFPDDPDRANRYYHEPILTPDFVRAEGRIRLLNLMTRGQVASQAAVVFGHRRAINFADKATWLPGESDLGIKNWRTIDWGGGLAADFWKAGYFADLFPSDELGYGTFAVDDEGYLRVGTQAYPVVVLTHLDADDVAAFRRLADGKALKTKVFAWDASGLPGATALAKNEAAEAVAYLDAAGAVRQPVAVGKRESWSKAWQGDILPLGDGTTTLTDGTVQRVKGAVNDIAGDDITGTLDLGNAKVEYAAKGVFAARADKDGRLAGLAAGGATRIKGLGIDLALEAPEDFALYRLPDGTVVGAWQTDDPDAEVPSALKPLAARWTKLLLPSSPRHTLVPAPQSFRVSQRPLPPEGYRLRIRDGKAEIEAADEAGRFYANATLKQLGANPPDLEIEDAPTYRWRGLHFDSVRHFFTVQEVKRFIGLMASLKFNVLHWHLTDDQGWRLPSTKYPKLNTVAATRTAKKGVFRSFRDVVDGEIGPQFYTEEELKEVIAFAAAHHVTIVPEVEMPGHSVALVRAYPELTCFGRLTSNYLTNDWNTAGTVKSVCPGKAATLQLFKDVLDEVVRIFPGETVHIGGDECNQGDWAHCPDCQAVMKAHGLRTTHELQSWFMKQVVDHLAAKGRKVLGWDEILEGGLPAGAKVMSWRGPKGGIAAAKAGVDAVMCPEEFCYFDFNQAIPDDPQFYPKLWGSPLPAEKVYRFDPAAGVPTSARAHILGGQGNNWGEFTCSEKELDWKCWLRAAALSETLWTAPAARDWPAFRRRLEVQRERFLAAGVNCAPVNVR